MSRFLPVYIYISTEFVNMKKKTFTTIEALMNEFILYLVFALNTTYITYSGE